MRYHSVSDPFRTFQLVFGGKWRLLIINELLKKKLRFSDLKKNIKGITPKMLTQELNSLLKYNLVEKNVYKEVPPRVEYTLSDKGITLFPLMEIIEDTGKKYMSEIEEIEIIKTKVYEKNDLSDDINKDSHSSIIKKPEPHKKSNYVQLELF